MEAPIPANEQERLDALRSFEVLDTDFEETFDRATRLASHIMGTPISVVSLVDEDRQWFKSVVGLDVRETPRSAAFCAHTILDDEVMVVEDASQDPRFSGNPLVVGDPNIRFYAGAPLIVDDGVRLGTLCAIDSKPRSTSEEQRMLLRDLAEVVVDELRLRKGLITEQRTNQLLVGQAHRLELANESLEQYAYMASHDLRAPLKRLINAVDLIQDEPDLADVYLPAMRRSAVEMEDLVVGYRRLSMLQPGPTEELGLANLVDKAKARVEPEVEVRCEGDGTVCADPTLVLQVFVNLFLNAQMHGAGGPVHCQIADVADSSNGGVSDSNGGVSDAHVGIRVSNPVHADLQIDRGVFAPFRRMSPVGEGRGLGLGLAIVDRIVKIHGGTVGASCFDSVFAIEIRLPVARSL